MKFSCNKEVILNEIAITQDIIASKNVLSTLSNVYLKLENGTLLIKATDMKVGFETIIPVNMEEVGETTVYCDKFSTILRSLPAGEISFSVVDNKMTITSGKDITFSLICIPPDNFPQIPEAEESYYFNFPQKEFNRMVNNTSFSVSDDETRYFLNGIYLEKNDNEIVMVATDGRRLSLSSTQLEENIPDFEGIIIPPKIMLLVKKMSSGEGNIKIAVIDKSFFIAYNNVKISSVLIEGQFPNYKKVIPEVQENSILVDRQELLEGLKRVSILVEQKSKKIILTIHNNSILLKSVEGDIGEAKISIPCNYDKEEISLALNFSYLSDPLKAIKEKTIQFEFTDQNKPVTIKDPSDDSTLHIVMPMQMD